MLTQSARRVGIARDKENREQNDFYPTPVEATEALLKEVRFNGFIWEPACGDGAISKVLQRHDYLTIDTDLFDRGYGKSGIDFLKQQILFGADSLNRGTNIVTNPPFRLVNKFIEHSCALMEALESTGKTALLMRLAALEGIRRRKIFERTPLSQVLVFTRRVKFIRPGWNDNGSQGTVAFAWFVWDYGRELPFKPEIGFI